MRPQLKLGLANKGRGEFRAEGTTLWLYDVIASDDDEAAWWGGVSPRQFIAALAAIDGPVTLRINSPGGSVFGAQAMVAAMRAHPHPITARIDSLAASAASVIAAEAGAVEIVSGAMIMIHKAWALAIGNADDMTATADLLAKLDSQIAASYARRGGNDQDWLTAMAAETWYTADEAVAAKLADRLITDSTQRPAQARWDLSAYAHAPAALMPAPAPSPPAPPRPAQGATTATQRAERMRQTTARLLASQS
jgi:ATP-dependent Clp protease, protease subunit